jgi:hypothetical protein
MTQKREQSKHLHKSFATSYSDENLMALIITDDETWIFGHKVETKQQSLQ